MKPLLGAYSPDNKTGTSALNLLRSAHKRESVHWLQASVPDVGRVEDYADGHGSEQAVEGGPRESSIRGLRAALSRPFGGRHEGGEPQPW